MDPEPISRVEMCAPPHLALHGTVDIFLARELLELAKRALDGEGDVRVDCRELERLDTSALQILLALQRQLAEHSRALQLLLVNEQVGAFLGFGGATGLLRESEAKLELAPASGEPALIEGETAGVDAERSDPLDGGWSDADDLCERERPDSGVVPLPDESELTRVDGEDE